MPRQKKTVVNIEIFIFVDNCLQYDAIHDFLVLLRTGSNPADINRFRSHTGNIIILNTIPSIIYQCNVLITNGYKIRGYIHREKFVVNLDLIIRQFVHSVEGEGIG